MKRKIIMVISTLVVILISVFVYFNFFYKDNTIRIKKKDNTVPVFEISLNDTTLEEINNNPKSIKYEDNGIKIKEEDKLLFEDNNITIKGRGHTTWDMPKKPYQITFSEEVNLFGLGSAKKWVLLANFLDETLLRNHLTFLLGRSLDMPYTNDGAFIDLYIDGEYQGLYYLTEKIEIGKDRVDLNNEDGVIMEIDNLYYKEEEYRFNSEREKTYITLKDIKNDELKEETFKRFEEKYNELENAILSGQWEKIQELCDIESFAKYYLISEFTENGDAYMTSFYLYMDGNDDKIHVGPIWDFDITCGNDVDSIFNNAMNYFKFNHFKSTVSSLKKTKSEKKSKIVISLMNNSSFRKFVKKIWKDEMRNTEGILLAEIDKQYEIIKESAYKNTEMWKYEDTYDESIEKLKDYIINRYDEMDEIFE